MADFYRGVIPILDVDNPTGAVKDALFHHPGATFGCVPRDYAVDPLTMREAPSGIKLYDPSEYDALYDEQEALQSSLEHIFLPNGPNGAPAFVNLDQGQDGDCWCYSTGHAIMFDRLKRNLEPVRLNPHSIAAMTGRPDKGGWCGLSGQFAREKGIAEEGTGPGQWKKQSHNMSYATPECVAKMLQYKVTEDWFDAARDVWDQKQNEQQLATCNFLNIPTPTDYNWWSHSVLRIRKVRISKGEWGVLILNSWLGWGRSGLGVLRGSQAIADNAIGVRVTTAS